MSKSQAVCTFSIHDPEPRIFGKVHGKSRWIIKLHAKNSLIKEEGKLSAIDEEIKSSDRCRLSEILDVAVERINLLMDEVEEKMGGYTEAGFEVFRLK